MDIDPNDLKGQHQGRPELVSGEYAMIPHTFRYGVYGDRGTPKLRINFLVANGRARNKADEGRIKAVFGRNVDVDMWISDDERGTNQKRIGFLMLAAGCPRLSVPEANGILAAFISSKVVRTAFAEHIAGHPMTLDLDVTKKERNGREDLDVFVRAIKPVKNPAAYSAAEIAKNWPRAATLPDLDKRWLEDDTHESRNRRNRPSSSVSSTKPKEERDDGFLDYNDEELPF